MKFNRSSRIAVWAAGAATLASLSLSGCAAPPSDPAARAAFERTGDPLEPLNRKTFELNQLLDRLLLRPIAKAYVVAVPDDARKAVHHVLDNMKEPTLFFNNLLQGEFKRAGISLGRFVVNSTVGFGGMADAMTLSGVERQPADFGQTLFVWGVPSGPYLVLPVLGPTNPRDAIGSTVDSYADPFTIVANDYGVTELLTSRLLIGGVDERAGVLDELDDLEKNSVDFYAELRSLAQQHRDAELRHGKAPEAAPGLYDDPNQPAPAPSRSPAGPPAKSGAGTSGPRSSDRAPSATRTNPRPSPHLAAARLDVAATAARQAATFIPAAASAPNPSPPRPEPEASAPDAKAAAQIAAFLPDTRGLDFAEGPAR
ncbi:MAG TPA: VacJ family lipoprotein [Stellaceae bacterium]|nr:VacJ family lipoprotein [Stellaceae bacterium]